jgi:hypothetical protein
VKKSLAKPGSPAELVSELMHHGVKGQRWGIRRDRSTGSGGGGKPSRFKSAARAVGRAADDVTFEVGKKNPDIQHQIAATASERLVKNLPSIKARHGDYGKLSNRVKKPFSKEAKAYRADVKKTYLRHLENVANETTNVRGTRRYTLKEQGKPNTSSYFWNLSTEAVTHAAAGTFRVQPVFDNEGYIINIKVIKDDMAQTMDKGANFLFHMGFDI